MLSTVLRAKVLSNLGVQSKGLLRTSEYTTVPSSHPPVSQSITCYRKHSSTTGKSFFLSIPPQHVHFTSVAGTTSGPLTELMKSSSWAPPALRSDGDEGSLFRALAVFSQTKASCLMSGPPQHHGLRAIFQRFLSYSPWPISLLFPPRSKVVYSDLWGIFQPQRVTSEEIHSPDFFYFHPFLFQRFIYPLSFSEKVMVPYPYF